MCQRILLKALVDKLRILKLWIIIIILLTSLTEIIFLTVHTTENYVAFASGHGLIPPHLLGEKYHAVKALLFESLFSVISLSIIVMQNVGIICYLLWNNTLLTML